MKHALKHQENRPWDADDLTDLEWAHVWLRSVRHAYKLAFGQRLASLNGRRVKTFDDRGLHPYSEMWGRIVLAEANSGVSGAIAERYLPPLSPESLRKIAEADAHQEFVKRIREESPDGRESGAVGS